MKILFVCLGNICRSPLAEGIFKHKIRERGLEDRFEANSCGTSTYHIGHPPDPRTIQNAIENGILLQHLGQQITPQHLETYDMILPMDWTNHAFILKFDNSAEYGHKIQLIREFDALGKGKDVPDPYHGDARDFQQVFEILDRSVEGLIQHLTSGISTGKW